jgi:cell division transport system permease protein
MITANLNRIIKYGIKNFWRQKFTALSVIFVLFVTIFSLTALFLFQQTSDYIIAQIKERVDIAVFFKKGTEEGKIFEIQNEIKGIPEVTNVEYISEEKALESFKEKHQNDKYYLDALEELGDNPFLASLNIKAQNPAKYPQITNFLNKSEFKDYIEKISYFENKAIIEKLFRIISNVRNFIIITFVIFGFLVILITFNTVRLSIFAKKEEIKTMHLVGASDIFLFGPFIVEGLIYILLSILACDLIFFFTLPYLGSKTQEWLSGFNIFNYFRTNIFLILTLQFVFSILITFSSIILAVKKYSKEV